MDKIIVTNLRNEKDLEVLAEQYSEYYCDSVLEEKWSKETAAKLFMYFYKQAPDLMFVAYDNNKPIGIIMTVLKPWWDGMHLEDGEVFVCKDYQKMGIAKMLFKTLFQYAIGKYDATTLEAHTYEDENGFPYSWYKRLGFETIDDWKIISGNIKEIIKKL